MTFTDFVAALSKEIGTDIETEGDSCAVSAGASDGSSVTVLLQGFDERGAVLATADLGAPPPGRPSSATSAPPRRRKPRRTPRPPASSCSPLRPSLPLPGVREFWRTPRRPAAALRGLRWKSRARVW